MLRSSISQPIEIRGSSAFGLPAALEISPIDVQGIWWKVPSGQKVPLGEAVVGVHRLFHYTTLSWGREVLRVPEHLLGMFFALGLDAVCITPRQSSLPYDGSAKNFWEGVQPVFMTPLGKLNLYTPRHTISVELEPGKYIKFFSDPMAQTLAYEIAVDYQGVGSHIFTGELDTTDMEKLFSARPYGRSRAHKMLSTLVRRNDQYVWFKTADGHAEKQLKLREIATHRLLDLLGVLMHGCPPGGTLVGKIATRPFVGHAADILLLNQIRMLGFKRVS